MTRLILLLSSTAFLAGQTPDNFFGAGISATASTVPRPAAWGVYAIQVNKSQQILSYTEVDESGTKSNGKFVLQSSLRTGAATSIKSIGRLTLWLAGTAGAATTGQNSGLSLAGDGFATVQLRKNGNLYAIVGIRHVTSTVAASNNLVKVGLVWRQR